MLLLPWVLGRPAGDAGELFFVFVMVMLGLFLLYLIGRYLQD